MELSEIANLISHGGVVALAAVVWWELREHRRELAAHRKEEVTSREVLAQAVGLIDRLVKRFDAIDAAEAQAAKVREVIRQEISDVHDMPESTTPPFGAKKRARSNPGGGQGQP